MSDYHDPVNIGTTYERTILEFAELVNELTGNIAGTVMQQAARIQGDPQTRRPDITRARTILDWEPTVGLRDGLKRTIDYFRDVM